MLEEKDLQAIANLIDIKLEPINGRLDKIDSRIDTLEQDLSEVKALATKTAIILENDVSQKINILYEGHSLNLEKMDLLIEKVDDLESTVLANDIMTRHNIKEIHELKKKA